MTVVNLIQHNSQGHKTAELIVRRNGSEATLYFKDGNVEHIAWDDDQGKEVIYDILIWQNGSVIPNLNVELPSIGEIGDCNVERRMYDLAR